MMLKLGLCLAIVTTVNACDGGVSCDPVTGCDIFNPGRCPCVLPPHPLHDLR